MWGLDRENRWGSLKSPNFSLPIMLNRSKSSGFIQNPALNAYQRRNTAGNIFVSLGDCFELH